MHYLRIDATHLHLLSLPTSADANNLANAPWSQCSLVSTKALDLQLQELRAEQSAFAASSPAQVLVDSPITFVPIGEFDEKDCDLIFNYCIKGDDRNGLAKRVFYDMLPTSNAVLLFALSEVHCQDLEHAFGEVHFLSAATPLLRSFANFTGNSSRRRAFIHCRANKVDVAFFDEQHLLIFNSFEVQSPLDVAYYALGVAQKLGIDLPQTNFWLVGLEAMSQDVKKQLQRYAPLVECLNLPDLTGKAADTLPNALPYELALQILQL